MTERTAMQSESWRPQRRAGVGDAQLVRMGVLAAGAVAMLGLGYAGYALVSRTPQAVPVIEADGRPLRVRPDNPGGMQVAGAEEQVMGGEASGRAATLAPPPEIPQPQTLRAQIQAARQPPPAQPVSLRAAPPPPPPTISALPEPRVVAVPLPRTVPPPATHLAAVVGGQVQFAALETEAAALAEWQRLEKAMPDLFATRHPAITRAERTGKTFYRLRTGGFADIAQATTFCTQVKAKGTACSVASF